MLDSVKIARRQSEIRQALAELAGKAAPSEDELRKMDELDREYRANETRYRAALIAEDTERREAGADLESRSEREWGELIRGFELRQVVLSLDEGRAIDGRTAEVVSQLRAAGGYRGVPVPWGALEVRVGETVASGVPNPMMTAPIIDRLFPDAVAARMGGALIAIDAGLVEYPVTTSSVAAGWADGETANVAGPTVYATTDRTLSPDHNLGIQMKLTRKALKQSGVALEAAIRRDMNSAMAAEVDKAAFLGTGSSGQPLGVIAGAATYGITSTSVAAAATWGAFRSGITRFLLANAARSPADVRLMIRPEVWDFMDSQQYFADAPDSQWDRLIRHVPAANIAMTSNALAAPTGTPDACSALLTTAAGGVPPFMIGAWGAVDVIRDPYSDAQSGGLRITALATMDIAVPRPAQLELLTGVQVEAA